MTQGSYKQFCPDAMAAEGLCTRWTPLVLRELMAGSTRFNDLRRGVPRMSPALLSQRLKELEAAGVVRRKSSRAEAGILAYHLTEAGAELTEVVEAMGVWGQRWIETEPSLGHLDVQLLMWDMHRNINTTPMPKRRRVIRFQYPELTPMRRLWWIVVEPGQPVDLCSVDPGFDVDLYVVTDLHTMTAIWMGLDGVRKAVATKRMTVTGDARLAADMQAWLGLSPFAIERKLAG